MSKFAINEEFLQQVEALQVLLKNNIADIVASDTHDMTERVNRLNECHSYIAKKYGVGYADNIFYNNPLKIIKNI